jgi:hypothetical protein
VCVKSLTSESYTKKCCTASVCVKSLTSESYTKKCCTASVFVKSLTSESYTKECCTASVFVKSLTSESYTKKCCTDSVFIKIRRKYRAFATWASNLVVTMSWFAGRKWKNDSNFMSQSLKYCLTYIVGT